MIAYPGVSSAVIRSHYDLSTVFYRLLWGPHIHHGYWDGEESSGEAQIKLVERVADLAAICSGQQVLDIGCGMGGSAIHLARTRGCRVTGITLSPVQRVWARLAAARCGVGRRTTFYCGDVEAFDFPSAGADVVWSLECTEHLFDKARFFRRAATWLRPGGRIAFCAWLAGRDLADDDSQRRRRVYEVCEGFFCPSLGSREDYAGWLEEAGLELETASDWTQRVLRTWEICRDRVRRSGVRRLAAWIDRHSVMFLDRFETILRAYQTGAMEYGCFVAKKPE